MYYFKCILGKKLISTIIKNVHLDFKPWCIICLYSETHLDTSQSLKFCRLVKGFSLYSLFEQKSSYLNYTTMRIRKYLNLIYIYFVNLSHITLFRCPF